MKIQFYIFFIFLLCTGCYDRSKEKLLEEKEIALAQKEQELLIKDNDLQLKEEDLLEREKLLDTSNRAVADTLAALHPTLSGNWNVTMRCTETTCAGSAVGDVKKEQWQIAFQSNTIIATATIDNKVVRVYSGNFIGNSFVLTAQQESGEAPQGTRIVVRLQKNKDNQLSGQREIIRPQECKIVYSLDLQKQ